MQFKKEKAFHKNVWAVINRLNILRRVNMKKAVLIIIPIVIYIILLMFAIDSYKLSIYAETPAQPEEFWADGRYEQWVNSLIAENLPIHLTIIVVITVILIITEILIIRKFKKEGKSSS